MDRISNLEIHSYEVESHEMASFASAELLPDLV